MCVHVYSYMHLYISLFKSFIEIIKKFGWMLFMLDLDTVSLNCNIYCVAFEESSFGVIFFIRIDAKILLRFSNKIFCKM